MADNGCSCGNPLFKAAEIKRQDRRVEQERRLEHEDFVLDKKKEAILKRKKELDDTNNERKDDLIWNSYSKWDVWEAERAEKDRREAVESKRKSMEAAAKDRASMMMGCHDKSKERAVFELSTAKKFEACRRFKKEGAAFFEEGQFFRSAAAYRKILVYLNYTFPDTPEETKEFDALKISSELNIAACKLKTGQYDEVIRCCSQVLNVDPKNVKALLRRARGHRLSDDFEASARDLKAAIEISPTNKTLRRELETLKSQQKGYRAESKRVSAAMFGGEAAGDDAAENGVRQRKAPSRPSVTRKSGRKIPFELAEEEAAATDRSSRSLLVALCLLGASVALFGGALAFRR